MVDTPVPDSGLPPTVWEILRIEPTSDLRAIRAAYEESPAYAGSDPDADLALRHSYETATLWSAIGLPPFAALGPGPAELDAALLRLAGEGGEAAGIQRLFRSGIEAIRVFFDPERFSGLVGAEIRTLHAEVETLATCIERRASSDEQTHALMDLLQHPALTNPDVSREVETILPFLLARSGASLEASENAIRHFGWRKLRPTTSVLHRRFVSDLLVAAAGSEILARFRDEARGWFRSWPRDPWPLVCEVLTGRFRPGLFLYARCFETVWFQLQQRWNELNDLPDWYLRLILDPRTHDYWRSRVGQSPSRLVSLARSLQLPVLAAGALVGLRTAWGLLAPLPAGTASTFLLGFIAIPILWTTTVAAHLLFFGLVWTVARLTGES